MERYDLAVIGSGPGGYPAAIVAAQKGLRVALIEAGDVGGTCLNRGCIPSKAMIAAARHYKMVQEASKFGIVVKGVSLDYQAFVARQREVVITMRKGLRQLIQGHGVELIEGFATFQTSRELKIQGEKAQIIHAEKIIIATGSEPRMIPAFLCDHKRILDSTSLLQMETLPKSLTVIGGGVIGCEFASLFHNLGVEVTILELMPSLVPMECKVVQQALGRAYKKLGIAVHTGVNVQKVTSKGKSVQVEIEGKEALSSEIVLVSIGRRLNTDNIGLEKVGVALTEQGQVVVNEQMETSVDGIYAIGDLTSRFWLAHVATHQGIVAAKRACGEQATMHYNAIPSVIFSDPEIATVGRSLEQAKEEGFDAAAGAFPFLALGKAQAEGMCDGFAQVVIDQKTGQILGAQVVGHEASTLIAEMTVAIANELTVSCLTETVHAHPTYSEAWPEALLLAAGHPLHLPPKRRMKK